MNIFVTGGNGFIGSALVEALVERGDQVTCLLYPGTKADWLKSPAVEFVEGDITQPDEAVRQAIAKAEVVFHLAGARIGLTARDFFRVNCDGTRRLLEVCQELHGDTVDTTKATTETQRAHRKPFQRFVLVSSATVSGPSELDDPAPEERQNPLTPYAASKLSAEQIALQEFSHALPLSIIRPTAVYGPRTTEWISLLESSLRWRINPIMGAFSNAHVNFIHVDDLVRALLLACEKEEAIGEVCTVGGFDYNWKDLGHCVSSSLGIKTWTLRIPFFLLFIAAGLTHLFSLIVRKSFEFNWWRAIDFSQKNWIFRLEKAERVLGYRPEITLWKGGRETIAWFLENRWVTGWGGKTHALSELPVEPLKQLSPRD